MGRGKLKICKLKIWRWGKNLQIFDQKIFNLTANSLLLLTAIVWGFAFVAQRVSMEYIGPFTFNAIRFGIGGLALLPLVYIMKRQSPSTEPRPSPPFSSSLKYSVIAGGVLFCGASAQQIGITGTTAGNAGFITGLYVIFVPLLGLLWRQRTAKATWLGAVLAVAGMYLLSATEGGRISPGDVWVLVGAVFWAGHVHIIAYLSPRILPVKLAAGQFLICSLCSFGVALLTEVWSWYGLQNALGAILYGGLVSVGIGYTLQVIAQRDAHPTHAAIIMSLEAVFALSGGVLLLGETLALRGAIGCGLMLAGMLLSQLGDVKELDARTVPT